MKDNGIYIANEGIMQSSIDRLDGVRKRLVSFGDADLMLEFSLKLIELIDKVQDDYKKLTSEPELTLREKVEKLYKEMKEQNNELAIFVRYLLVTGKVIIDPDFEVFTDLRDKLEELGCLMRSDTVYLVEKGE